jgi:Transglutaminase elicitor
MPSAELSKLSPAEKMDIYLGNSDFRITKRELQERATTRNDKGGGFCNGARAAGFLTKEPTKNIQVKPNGFPSFEFYPADIKALFAVSYFYPEQTVRLGDLTCYVQPDILDISLRYFIGEKNEGLCGDMDPRHDHINNMAILGYDRAIDPFIAKTDNGGRLVKVRLTLYCLTEFSPASSNQATKALVADFRNHIGEGWLYKQTYEYNLVVNDKDEIISGTWLNPVPTDPNVDFHPDFVWMPHGKGNDQSYKSGHGNPYLKYDDILKLSNL